MRFMDSYKHLEKLCGEVMDDPRKLSAYIDEMESKRLGSRYVAGWDRDLKNLKHYRWVRNRIVHEPDCSEETMCDEEDAMWLEDFYERIMEQTDPLALYRRATQVSREPVRPDCVQPAGNERRAGCTLLLLAAVGLIALLGLLLGLGNGFAWV